jgi:FkbM family methyltransferase
MFKKHKFLILLAKLFSNLRYRYFKCDGYYIFGNILDATVRKAYINNTFEDDALFNKIAFFLGENSTYLDIGANYGFHFSGILNSLTHNTCRIHLIEPNKDCFFCLKNTINKNLLKNVLVHGIALDKENCRGTFEYNKNCSVTGSLNNKFINFQKKSSLDKNWKKYDVQKLTLDTWMNDNVVEEVQVMKLDTSGFDWNIYTGGRKAFEAGKIKVLFFDILKNQLLLHGTKSSNIINFLMDNKYTIFNSIGGTENDSVEFSLREHKKKFNLLNIQNVIKNEDCLKTFPHIHGLAIHDSFLQQIVITER